MTANLEPQIKQKGLKKRRQMMKKFIIFFLKKNEGKLYFSSSD